MRYLASDIIGDVDGRASANDACLAAALAADADLIGFDGVELHQGIVHRVATAVYGM